MESVSPSVHNEYLARFSLPPPLESFSCQLFPAPMPRAAAVFVQGLFGHAHDLVSVFVMAFRNSYSGYPCGSGTSWSRTVQSKELPWFSSALECFDTRVVLQIALKMGLEQNNGQKCSKSSPFPYSLVSGVQDTCGQGRVQVVFQKDFLSVWQSGL